MRISFYEEFPTKENLEKLRLVRFETQVFLAAKSVMDYTRILKAAKCFSGTASFGYWPVLDKKDGYWISPFSNRAAVVKVIADILSCKSPLDIVWDSELPVLSPFLFVKNLFCAQGTKSFIHDFCMNPQNKRLFITENVFVGSSWVAKLLGVYLDGAKVPHSKTLMFYSSMMPPGMRFLCLKRIVKEKRLIGDSLSVAVGVLSTGIHGREQIISPAALDRDLRGLRRIGIDHVFVFRLGGLNKQYVKVIEKYVS